MSTEHTIKEDSGGNGWTIWVTAVCSCGWRSKPNYGFNNPSYPDYVREVKDHVAASQQEGKDKSNG